jgi:predicted helicase
MRQVVGDLYNHILVSDTLNDMNILASHHVSQVTFPLYLYNSDNEMKLDNVRRSNFNPDFTKAISNNLKLDFIEDGEGDLKETLGPEDIFNYSYAIFHSTNYRHHYSEFLKMDFPRLPITSQNTFFKNLVEKGKILVNVHLLQSPLLNKPITIFEAKGLSVVEKVNYEPQTQRIYINKTQYFGQVPLDIWNFHIGGYQVCNKWLKDRKGRVLSAEDINHYQKIVVALNETIRLMKEIDEVIDKYGGWPGAFL